jgi:hypothetical protein
MARIFRGYAVRRFTSRATGPPEYCCCLANQVENFSNRTVVGNAIAAPMKSD